ncbi:hypothetical protein ThrDRAFT_01376 [Frankia casuarinae]|uniref:Uncharacterized protein n=2 Tax=Frankia casuarinae (strain DSM 45818 / CECT 9043 / HFP020203 / CcI3) TaxID=106370 RepID=Q2JG42_FRACC|nr:MULTISPECIES: hypothetical protein [Frankia]ABD09750.1 hypothetical protein Francci3_0363 [Frankia casuarinae]ETA02268.1 hypothetical protein CcI6DRAFT_02257 [Frankia sp. CcI6]EYT92993.1 hypothetical protein ThrDRAFT_01376 [Frankia casuarinae]KDA43302.1 hypothetical protein BMG523Draft_01803 [Frankia sp. BMG5.23]KEZ36734.1 hypothetical protein CEDDRAFT_01914 [Frankia sp. CeD]
MSLLGWRQWAVDARGQLRPAWTPWSPFPPGLLLWRADGMTEAHCLRTRRPDRDVEPGEPGAGHGRVPDEHCACGLYAWRDPSILAAARPPRWTSLPYVVGVVRLGGRVIVGERGYRAERGYPVAVLDRDGVVSDDYAVARYRSYAALVAEWADPSATPRGQDRAAG